MVTKYNKWFEMTAADPVLRREAIADYSKRRTILFCCALVSSACALMMWFTPTHNPNSPVLLGLSAALLWIVYSRIASHLWTLKMLDKVSDNKGEKATA